MTSEEATQIVSRIADLFPRWKTTPTLKLEFRDALMRFPMGVAAEAASAHRRQRRGDDPSIADLLNLCDQTDRERYQARVSNQTRRDDQTSQFCELHRLAWHTPGMSDTDVFRRYWASQAAKYATWDSAEGNRRKFWRLVVNDLTGAGCALSEAEAFANEVFPAEQAKAQEAAT